MKGIKDQLEYSGRQEQRVLKEALVMLVVLALQVLMVQREGQDQEALQVWMNFIASKM